MTVSPLVHGYYCNYGNIWLIGPRGTLRGEKPDVAIVAVVAVLATGRINMPRSHPSFLGTARHVAYPMEWATGDLHECRPTAPSQSSTEATRQGATAEPTGTTRHQVGPYRVVGEATASGPIASRRGRFGWCSLNDNCNYQP